MTGKENVKKGEATRLAIEEAAIQLFLKQGYHATSMRPIALAGIALRSTPVAPAGSPNANVCTSALR